MVLEHKDWQSPVFVAQVQFWGSPDLVAQLLTFLDVSSTLALATALPLAQDLLQLKSIWGNLMSRSIVFQRCEGPDQEEEQERAEEMNKAEVAQLVAILKMLKFPELLLPELLDMICDRFQNHDMSVFNITMSCSRHIDHVVNREGFQLLEVAEGMMGTSVQQIKSIMDHFLDEDLDEVFELALSARLSRQTELVHYVALLEAEILSNQGLTATLLQKTLKWDIPEILIRDLGEDGQGWSWFAKGMQCQPSKKVKQIIDVSKQVIIKAKKDDLKTVWDATCEYGHWETGTGSIWADLTILERDCSGSCRDVTEPEVCRYRDKRDKEGKIVDCGWERLEEIWDAGQK